MCQGEPQTGSQETWVEVSGIAINWTSYFPPWVSISLPVKYIERVRTGVHEASTLGFGLVYDLMALWV